MSDELITNINLEEYVNKIVKDFRDWGFEVEVVLWHGSLYIECRSSLYNFKFKYEISISRKSEQTYRINRTIGHSLDVEDLFNKYVEKYNDINAFFEGGEEGICLNVYDDESDIKTPEELKLYMNKVDTFYKKFIKAISESNNE